MCLVIFLCREEEFLKVATKKKLALQFCATHCSEDVPLVEDVVTYRLMLTLTLHEDVLGPNKRF